MSLFARELEVARAVALEAAELVRRYTGNSLAVDQKPGNEPVTEADRAANALVVERLRAAFPADVILSEELPDDGSRLGRPRVWMVDPIDGTREFINGSDEYAVMIGLSVEGQPRVGVVSQPPTRRTYSGVVGHGAWIDEADGRRRPLRTSTLAGPPGIRLVASKSNRTSHIDVVKQALGITDEMNIGSVGLKMGLVAEAVRDVYIYPGAKTKLWDTCGPQAILDAAGGRVTDVTGRPLVYDSPDLANARGILASNGPLHDLCTSTLM